MPVYNPEFQPPALLGNYPNIQKRDLEIWERFLKHNAALAPLVAYNVGFGGQYPDDPEATEEQRLGWAYSTAAKPDVVIKHPSEVWLVEVKPGASYSAVGQALGYLLLAAREDFYNGPMVPTIITDRVGPDMFYVCEQLGIQLILVPEDDPKGFLVPGPDQGGAFLTEDQGASDFEREFALQFPHEVDAPPPYVSPNAPGNPEE